MFLEMRRKEKQITKDECEKILHKGEYGVLSTMGLNGYPYSTPLNYVYFEENIYFHSAIDGHKLQNIKSNKNVCFSVVGDIKLIPEKFTTNYESVVMFGQATTVIGKEKINALLALINKYSNDYLVEGDKYILKDNHITEVVRISIDHMTGKISEEI
jgi:nitroimidazol reductase NimA-like FMN-containing flavoprotein (pyridoxamine 5'-phosphate oxidase superfamily)